MIIRRSNLKSAAGPNPVAHGIEPPRPSAGLCKHMSASRLPLPLASLPPNGGGQPPGGSGPPIPGDILYGAKAIARFLFGDEDTRARRRVFNLWAHYRDRKEAAGFFKLKGALCLSKSRWWQFHGLG